MSLALQVRDHLVVDEGDGMVTVTGGKWTTYRRMAEDAVGAAVAAGGLAPRRGCVTGRLLLLGAPGYSAATFAHLAQVCFSPHTTEDALHLLRAEGPLVRPAFCGYVCCSPCE
jgi:glycerol-3-phosphate dehydrogenase